ncbi:Rv1733c family protein [Amycolatopsis methanolica]|uniref:Transmembrane protein n=1 Tax=Amycolatopsis methanolica 239 TaxID=1068978 RepID=A0A076N004_AMYME|nr:hypothetical protein [Amycolatopsis methanolica]AIJ23142.1 transmembrane protein [Amycolatopsis methanolica 239]
METWRPPRLRGNPLTRDSDRRERLALLVAVTVVVLTAPFAALLGDRVHQWQERLAVSEQDTRTAVTATLLADAPPPAGYPESGTARVEAEWPLPAGGTATGEVTAPRGAVAGDAAPIWIDENGEPAAPPVTAETAVVNGVTTGALSWAAVMALCGLGFWLYRRVLDRRRRDDWSGAWDRFDSRHTPF